MSRIRGEVLICRPVEKVFDFVVDERNEPTYNADMLVAEKLTEGPIGVGSRFRATVGSGRRQVKMRIAYTAFDRPNLIASTTRIAAAEFSGPLTFTSSPVGPLLRCLWQACPKVVMWLKVAAHAVRRHEVIAAIERSAATGKHVMASGLDEPGASDPRSGHADHPHGDACPTALDR